jgi:hypothetical protein
MVQSPPPPLRSQKWNIFIEKSGLQNRGWISKFTSQIFFKFCKN